MMGSYDSSYAKAVGALANTKGPLQGDPSTRVYTDAFGPRFASSKIDFYRAVDIECKYFLRLLFFCYVYRMTM